MGGSSRAGRRKGGGDALRKNAILCNFFCMVQNFCMRPILTKMAISKEESNHAWLQNLRWESSHAWLIVYEGDLNKK